MSDPTGAVNWGTAIVLAGMESTLIRLSAASARWTERRMIATDSSRIRARTTACSGPPRAR